MRLLIQKFKPTSGFSHAIHVLLLILLPAIIYVLIRSGFVPLAYGIVILSKWRMFAVKPRFWAANLRANSVDLMVGFSVVVFMSHTSSALYQFIWASLYAIWLVVIKPRSGRFMITIQAFIGQLLALTALYQAWSDGSFLGLTFMSGLICFCAARHVFDSFEEPYARLLSYFWGYFGAALSWVLSHWLIYHASIIPEPVLLTCALGFGLAAIYYLDHEDKLSKLIKREILFIMLLIVIVVVYGTIRLGGKVI
jgi:hypothetical protein